MKVTKSVTGRTQRQPNHTKRDKPWRKAFGGLRDLHSETRRIERYIAQQFERIETEDWR